MGSKTKTWLFLFADMKLAIFGFQPIKSSPRYYSRICFVGEHHGGNFIGFDHHGLGCTIKKMSSRGRPWAQIPETGVSSLPIDPDRAHTTPKSKDRKKNVNDTRKTGPKLIGSKEKNDNDGIEWNGKKYRTIKWREKYRREHLTEPLDGSD